MAVRGGDIVELSYSNSVLGLQGTFKVKANEGNTFDPGGVRTNDDATQVTSNGEPIWQQNMKMGGATIVIVNDMSLKTDNVCAQLASSESDTTWTFTVINGKSYRGTGMIVGDITPNVNDSTLSIKIACPTLKQL